MVIPAIDLLGGKVVRLTEGDFGRAKEYSDDPEATLRSFAEMGAGRVHVVDLDAAGGRGDNRKVIEAMLRGGLQLQVAGGIREAEAVEHWLSAGATAVVMGTAAVKQPDLLAELANRHPQRILAALDVKAGEVAYAGWSESEPVAMGALLLEWDRAPLGGVIVTAVDRDGTLEGPDLALIRDAREMTRHRVTYSGGVRSLEDIRGAIDAGATSVILGKALYESRIDLRAALAL